MKFTVYATKRSFDCYDSSVFWYKARRIKYYETEADNLLDAMAKFAKDQKKLLRENEKIGWTVTHTASGFTVQNDGFGEEYTNIAFNS